MSLLTLYIPWYFNIGHWGRDAAERRTIEDVVLICISGTAPPLGGNYISQVSEQLGRRRGVHLCELKFKALGSRPEEKTNVPGRVLKSPSTCLSVQLNQQHSSSKDRFRQSLFRISSSTERVLWSPFSISSKIRRVCQNSRHQSIRGPSITGIYDWGTGLGKRVVNPLHVLYSFRSLEI